MLTVLSVPLCKFLMILISTIFSTHFLNAKKMCIFKNAIVTNTYQSKGIILR